LHFGISLNLSSYLFIEGMQGVMGMERVKKIKRRGVSFKNTMYFGVLTGVGVSVIMSLLCICAFALAIKWFDIQDGAIAVVNQILKVLSVVAGVYAALRLQKKQGFAKGSLIGVLFMAVTYFLFACVEGNFNFWPSLFSDMLMGLISGGLSGILFVNLSKK
jgi:putative membrane protein (TIGR04086 family)